MDVAIIDYYANHGRSFLHRASTLPKITFAVLSIASVVITSDLYLLLGIYISLSALVIWSRLPIIRILSIAAYPAIFALIFALASWNGSWVRAGVIIMKALTAAITMVILIVTTPYPDIFVSIRPVLPKIIAEALVMTYRSIFILLELMNNLVKALRVRGGLTRRKYVSNVVNFSTGIGLLLIRGLDLSEKFYGVMTVRGYGGKISAAERKGKPGINNICIALIGLLIFTAGLVIRLGTGIQDISIFILVFSVLIFFVSVITVPRVRT